MLWLFIIKLKRSHQPSSAAKEATKISSWTSSHSDAAELSAAHIQLNSAVVEGGKLIAKNMIKMRSVPDKNSSISDHVLDVREHGTWQPHSSNWYREDLPRTALFIFYSKMALPTVFPERKNNLLIAIRKTFTLWLCKRMFVFSNKNYNIWN